MGSKNSKNKKKNPKTNTNTNTNTKIHLENSQINKSINQVLKKNENNNDKEEVKTKNKEILNIPPPNFKNFKKFDFEGILFIGEFRIYKLKEINNAFYISFIVDDESIVVYKCYYENYMLEKIITKKMFISIKDEVIMRYFYNELDKKEYLFVEKGLNNLFIYLIKDEKHYELINREECKDSEYNRFEVFDNNVLNEIMSKEEKLDLFEVIYNQFDKNVYIITIQSIGHRSIYMGKGYDSKNFNIKIFKENKFISSDLSYSKYYLMSNDLIYEDNHSKKYYILSLIEKKYIMIQIKEYIPDKTIDIETIKDVENIVYSEKDIKTLDDFFHNVKDLGVFIDKIGKKIFYGYNGNFLYLSKNNERTSSEVIVIDLFKRKIIKHFILDIYICSFENWGLQNIIILSTNSIYIFDPYTFQIIAKYSYINNNYYRTRIMTYFSKENNFYGLFINSSEFQLMYLNKNKKK